MLALAGESKMWDYLLIGFLCVVLAPLAFAIGVVIIVCLIDGVTLL